MSGTSERFDPVVWGLFQSLSTWDGMPTPGAVAALREKIRLNSDERIAFFNKHLADLKKDLPAWTSKFVPDDIAFGLGFINEVKLTRAIRDMAALADHRGGEAAVEDRIRSEGFKLSILTLFKAMLEASISQDAFNDALHDLMNAIEPKVFGIGSREVPISMRHDPERQYRVVEVGVDRPLRGNPEQVFAQRVLCRTNIDGRPCICQVDEKEPTEITLKVLSKVLRPKPGEHPLDIVDRVRVRFIFETLADVKRMIQTLPPIIHKLGAQCSESEGNLLPKPGKDTSGTLQRMDAENERSSPLYRAEKLIVTWEGIPIEFQLTTMEHFFSARYAVDESHHAIYKFKGSIPLLKAIYPFRIYRTDFDDPEFQEIQKRAMRETAKIQMKARRQR